MRVWVLIGLALGVRGLCAQNPAIAFEHVRVFDGEALQPATTVVIADGKIVQVGAGEVPAGAQRIDGTGKTLMPGLIDAHAHVHGPLNLQESLVFGVTTELDMMSNPAAEQRLKQHENSSWADLRYAGYAATVPGGHGTEYGMAVPTIEKPGDAQAFVDARIAEGSDYIKLVYGDSTIFGGRLARPPLSKKTMAAVIAAAHARGKLTMVHINTEQDARDALDAGADGLAHLFFGGGVGKDFGQFVAAHHAFVVPTLSVLSGTCDAEPTGEALLSDVSLTPFMTAAQKVRLATGRRKTMLESGFRWVPPAVSCDGAKKAVKLLRAAGVTVLAGTDAPNPGTAHGVSVHGELAELVRAGMTPTNALAGATGEVARVFALADRGRIAPGLRADILLVEGDPTADILATRHIVGIWKEGGPVRRAVPSGPGDDGAQLR